MRPMFSIIVVSLNPGEKLIETLESIRSQSFADYQVVVKDGGSKDDSPRRLREKLAQDPAWNGAGKSADETLFSDRVQIVEQRDKSIYEGMNQAAALAEGEYFYFLNCGDTFAHDGALEEMAEGIRRDRKQGGKALVYYGDVYDALRGQVIPSNPSIDEFACYRYIPCHQACVYHRSLFAERGYRTEFKVRGDYEHFLWSYFKKNACPKYLPVTLASYEGGGFSETKENRVRSAREHEEITRMYMSRGQILRYKAILLLTLSPLRTKMAESAVWSGLYMKLKKLIYRK